MAQNHSFRSAFNGFNREDVVRYIEYINKKHTDLVNQLNSEKQSLLDELNGLRAQVAKEDLSQQVAQLEEECAQLKARCEELEAAGSAPATPQQPAERTITEEELEAYRRAERMERAAKEHSRQIYRQATATLAEATAQIDTASASFRQIAEKVNAQMAELQTAVEGSKAALMDASATMYAIRPEDEEE